MAAYLDRFHCIMWILTRVDPDLLTSLDLDLQLFSKEGIEFACSALIGSNMVSPTKK